MAEVEVDIDVGEVEVGKVDDEIGEINGGTEDKVGEGMANDKIGEIHDDVGGWEVEVYVEVVGVGVLVLGFSVNEHILLISPCDCSERE